MAYKIDPLDAEQCDYCGKITFAWVQPCGECQAYAKRVDAALAALGCEKKES